MLQKSSFTTLKWNNYESKINIEFTEFFERIAGLPRPCARDGDEQQGELVRELGSTTLKHFSAVR
jgi:hypothetical protein